MANRFFHLAMVAVPGVVIAAVLVYAGPLSPSAGPVASTYKTLSEVEPRTGIASLPFSITQPGSYYLTRNLTIPAGQVGIQITASAVTLDLSGFTISGNGTSSDGIDIASQSHGVTIRNGSISDVAGNGIDAGNGQADLADGLTVESVRVLTATGRGITGSRGAAIRGCYVNGAQVGIRSGYSSAVQNCTVEFATQTAFSIEGGSLIEHSVAVGTTGGPTNGRGFVFGTGNTAVNCVARSNTGDGFVTADQALLRGCSSTANSGNGFVLGSDSRLETCLASLNAAAAVQGAAIRNWEVTGCTLRVNAGGNAINVSGNSLYGRVVDTTMNGPPLTTPDATGILLPAGSLAVIKGNTFNCLSRGIVIDRDYHIVTGNAFVMTTTPITTTLPGLILLSPTHVIGPIVDYTNSANTTNPLVNTKQGF